MANILVATTPSLGHVNPFLPIVRELITRGHTVRWYTGKAYQPHVEATGATFDPIISAIDHSGMAKEEAFPHLKGLEGLQDFIGSWKSIFLDAAPQHMQDMLAILNDFPADLLLSDETTFGMGFVREKTNLPHVVISTSVYFYRSRDTPPLGLGMLPNSSFVGRIRNRLLAFMADKVILRELPAYARKTRLSVGLPPLPGGVLQNVNRKPNLYLMATIPAFEYPRSDIVPNTHFIGSLNRYTITDFQQPDWWDLLVQAEKPVVYITQGTVNNRDVGQLLKPAVDALADEDVVVIATTGGLSPVELGLTDLPAHTYIEAYVPHGDLLAHVDVMITNGGYGGVQNALQRGVPLVIAGATEEKPDVAAHVEWVGAGVNMRASSPTPYAIKQAVQQVLQDPKYANRARELEAEFARYDAVANAIKHIEQLLNDRSETANTS